MKCIQGRRWKLFIPLAFFVVFAGLLYFGLFREGKGELPSALLDKPVPAFSLPTLKEPEKIVTESDLLGQVFLLNVWGSWCAACRVEHPYLMELAESGAALIGVNYKDKREDALQWLQRLEDPYRFSIVDSDGRLGLDLGVYGAPETFLIDSRGVIRYRHVGVVDDRAWREDLQPLYEMLKREQEQGP